MKTGSRNAYASLALGGVLLASVGCGGPFDATATGVVTLDGEPITRGTVSFQPQFEGSLAVARIDDSGGYRARTGREYGLAAGEYVVTVVAREPPASATGRDGGPPPAGRMITPDWYRSGQTSGLSFTVERGSNTINLELSSDPPPGWKPSRRRRR
ncbi:MAG: hypothetical protein AAGB00_09340 [Planctomycetota bacterium]